MFESVEDSNCSLVWDRGRVELYAGRSERSQESGDISFDWNR